MEILNNNENWDKWFIVMNITIIKQLLVIIIELFPKEIE